MLLLKQTYCFNLNRKTNNFLTLFILLSSISTSWQSRSFIQVCRLRDCDAASIHSSSSSDNVYDRSFWIEIHKVLRKCFGFHPAVHEFFPLWEIISIFFVIVDVIESKERSSFLANKTEVHKMLSSKAYEKISSSQKNYISPLGLISLPYCHSSTACKSSHHPLILIQKSKSRNQSIGILTGVS